MIERLAPSGKTAAQFVKFGLVGVIGFLVDASALYGLLAATDLGLYLSRIVSFLLAATATWILNRTFTFSDAVDAPVLPQWLRFVTVNAAGGLVNYGVYVVLLLTFEALHGLPIVAVAAGSLAGLAVNFAASRRFVFRAA